VNLQQALFSPRSVAVVGQSDDAGKTAGRPLKFLRQMGYAGRIYPINPRRETVLGERAWPSLTALPEPPDHVYVVAPTAAAVEAVEECGRLGVKVATVLADHGQFFAFEPAGRLFNPELAGGALLDLGIYPLSFAAFVLGEPDAVSASGSLTATDVDAQVAAILTKGAAQAVVNATLLAKTPTTASISGSAGRLEISGPFYAPGRLTLTGTDDRQQIVREPDSITGHQGLCFEAAHLATLVAERATESPLLPLAETVSVLRTADAIRQQVGVRFPGE